MPRTLPVACLAATLALALNVVAGPTLRAARFGRPAAHAAVPRARRLAQEPGTPAVIFPAAELAQRAATLTPAARARRTALAALGDYPGYEILLELRGADGAVEVHAHADDFLVIRAGSATLVSGGTVVGARLESGGETRGSSIRGGERRTVVAGDVIRVPAGTPHQFLVPAGAVVSILAVKIRR